MPTAPSDRRPARHASATTAPALLLAVSLVLLTGCGAGDVRPPVPPASPGTGGGVGVPSAGGGAGFGEGDPSGIEGLPVPEDLAQDFTRLLRRRERAVLAGDRAAFLAGLDVRDRVLVADQETYFDNLQQLPLEEFRYRLDRASLVRQGAGYWVVVELALQLDGYDDAPSKTLDRFRFSRLPDGAFRLGSVTDQSWEEANDVQQQPWDMRPVEVRTGAGVLGVFDAGTVTGSRSMLRSFERGIADVSPRVPYPWDRRVVVYALSDTAFLEQLDNLPGEDPDALDGVTFTISAGRGTSRVADTRIALNPRLLRRTGPVRDRLVRHELTHVAVAAHDDNAPTWLSEGIAEWVSAQALTPRQRRVSEEGLDEAQDVRRMPDEATFNDTDAEVHYTVAWWACEYLVATYGENAPWVALDAFAEPVDSERETITTLLRYPPDALARRGVRLLLKTYDPARLEPTQPETESTGGTGAPPSGGAGGGAGTGAGAGVTPGTSGAPSDGSSPASR